MIFFSYRLSLYDLLLVPTEEQSHYTNSSVTHLAFFLAPLQILFTTSCDLGFLFLFFWETSVLPMVGVTHHIPL